MCGPSAVVQFQVQMRRAMSGILKRKFEEVEASSSPCSSLRESDDEVSCSESGDSSDSVNPSASGPFTRECLCGLRSCIVLSVASVCSKINVIISSRGKQS